jgi:hypothetical protein
MRTRRFIRFCMVAAVASLSQACAVRPYGAETSMTGSGIQCAVTVRNESGWPLEVDRLASP